MTTKHEWQGRPILSADDVHELEQSAAVNEFHARMPRAKAEELAYEQYKQGVHAQAAAHHLDGKEAAHAIGNIDHARHHHEQYAAHMKVIGADPDGPVPDVVKKHKGKNSVYKFKTHGADAFLEPKQDATPGEVGISKSEDDRLATLYRAANLLIALKKAHPLAIPNYSDVHHESHNADLDGMVKDGLQEQAPEFHEVAPHEFEKVLKTHPRQESLDHQRDYNGKRTFLSKDGQAGYALKDDGELNHVFSLKPGWGAHAVRHALANGAEHLSAFDGKLPAYYSQFGFAETKRDKNWTPGQPDVVWMRRQK